MTPYVCISILMLISGSYSANCTELHFLEVINVCPDIFQLIVVAILILCKMILDNSILIFSILLVQKRVFIILNKIYAGLWEFVSSSVYFR